MTKLKYLLTKYKVQILVSSGVFLILIVALAVFLVARTRGSNESTNNESILKNLVSYPEGQISYPVSYIVSEEEMQNPTPTTSTTNGPTPTQVIPTGNLLTLFNDSLYTNFNSGDLYRLALRNYGIYINLADGTFKRVITNYPVKKFEITPDKKRIIFIAMKNPSSVDKMMISLNRYIIGEIYEYNLDTKVTTELTSEVNDLFHLSSDGKYIFFTKADYMWNQSSYVFSFADKSVSQIQPSRTSYPDLQFRPITQANVLLMPKELGRPSYLDLFIEQNNTFVPSKNNPTQASEDFIKSKQRYTHIGIIDANTTWAVERTNSSPNKYNLRVLDQESEIDEMVYEFDNINIDLLSTNKFIYVKDNSHLEVYSYAGGTLALQNTVSTDKAIGMKERNNVRLQAYYESQNIAIYREYRECKGVTGYGYIIINLNNGNVQDLTEGRCISDPVINQVTNSVVGLNYIVWTGSHTFDSYTTLFDLDHPNDGIIVLH